jgi:hypothetical protein
MNFYANNALQYQNAYANWNMSNQKAINQSNPKSIRDIIEDWAEETTVNKLKNRLSRLSKS